MQKMRKGIVLIASMLLVANLFLIDYQDLGSSENFGPYAGVAAMALVIISQILGIRHDKKHPEKS